MTELKHSPTIADLGEPSMRPGTEQQVKALSRLFNDQVELLDLLEQKIAHIEESMRLTELPAKSVELASLYERCAEVRGHIYQYDLTRNRLAFGDFFANKQAKELAL